MKVHVWNFCAVTDDVPVMISERIPKDIAVYPLVIASSEQNSIIGLNPKRGYLLLRNGIKTEEQSLRELLDMHLGYPTGAWGWEKEFVSGLKHRPNPVDPYKKDRELAAKCRENEWTDVAYVEDGRLYSEDGVQIFKEI